MRFNKQCIGYTAGTDTERMHKAKQRNAQAYLAWPADYKVQGCDILREILRHAKEATADRLTRGREPKRRGPRHMLSRLESDNEQHNNKLFNNVHSKKATETRSRRQHFVADVHSRIFQCWVSSARRSDSQLAACFT